MKPSLRMSCVAAGLTLILCLAGIGCKRHLEAAAKSRDRQLLRAARRGDTASVERLLKQGGHIEAEDDLSDSTPLALAADYGHADTVNLLLAHGANPVAGRIAGVEVLVDAARIANPAKVRLLLDRGTDLQARNDALFAVGESEPAIMQVEQPVPPIPSQPNDAEHEEAEQFPAVASAETAVLLLKYGADVQARDTAGSTPLINAAAHGATRVVAVLLVHGSEVDARDKDGNTGLIEAACECAIATMPSTVESMELLLKMNADVNAKAKDGSTALMTAAGWGRTEQMKLLLDHGARLDAVDGAGNTPLLIASWGAISTASAVELLLSRGAKIEARNRDGETPLLLASSKPGYEDVKIVDLLLKKGADARARDKHGRSALDLAAKQGRAEIVSLLEHNRSSSVKGNWRRGG